jgi:hypothetical protein
MREVGITLRTTVGALAYAVISLPPGHAVGQQKALAEQLVGTWVVVSNDTVSSDGSRVPTFGLHPKGIAIFDASGRCVVQFVNTDIPNFASNNRLQGTPEENKAAVGGSISVFGTYAVNEINRTVVIHVDAGSYPNWNGTDQKRIVAINGDEVTLTNTVASGGGTAVATFRRAK